MLVRALIVLAATVGVLAAAFFGLTRQYTIHSSAMAPAIKPDDHVAVFRFSDWFYTPHRKDVVVFETPARASVDCGTRGALRVIGLPGETVAEHSGVVSIDGKPLKEPYVKAGRRDRRTGSWHVPTGRYFLMGDSRRVRCDSRTFGSILTKRVVGKVFFTFWPFDRVSIG
jgi:signal peptidase I